MRPLLTCTFLALCASLLPACDSEDDGDTWSGTCSIPAAPVIGMDVNLDIQLNEMVLLEGAMIVNGSGDWTFYEGQAVTTEAGTRSETKAEIYRCESEGGCANQGDPYTAGQTLFEVNAGGDLPQEVIMKGTSDDGVTYSGVCQTRRSGQLLTGTFTMTKQ